MALTQDAIHLIALQLKVVIILKVQKKIIDLDLPWKTSHDITYR